MLETIAQIIFYGVALLFAVYSFIISYVLLRFGQSKTASLTLIALYIFALAVVFSTAQYYLGQIEFPTTII